MNANEYQTSEPLVTVAVFTYNSEKYVLETLESIKEQFYPNIELIISDDGSTDQTLEMCNDWVNKNSSIFTNTMIVTSHVNSGIVNNLNRGIKTASGEWIKTIAGDDLLIKNSISQYVDFIQQHPVNVVAAMRYYFYNDDPNTRKPTEEYELFNHPKITASQQYQIALRGYGAPHNTWFFRKGFVETLGFYDKRFPMMEDWPMKLKVLKSGEKIAFIDKYTVLYRVHQNSVSVSNKGKIYSSWYINAMKPVKEQLMLPHLPWDERLIMNYDLFIAKLFYRSFLNNYNLINRTIKYLLRIPVEFCNNWFIKRLIKSISLQLEPDAERKGLSNAGIRNY